VTRLGCAVLNWFGKVRRELIRGGSWFGGSWFGLKGDVRSGSWFGLKGDDVVAGGWPKDDDAVAGDWPKDDDASWLGGVGAGSC